MGNVVVSQFMSLDGVVEDPGGSEHSDRGGWAFKFDRGAEGDRFKLDEVMASIWSTRSVILRPAAADGAGPDGGG